MNAQLEQTEGRKMTAEIARLEAKHDMLRAAGTLTIEIEQQILSEILGATQTYQDALEADAGLDDSSEQTLEKLRIALGPARTHWTAEQILQNEG